MNRVETYTWFNFISYFYWSRKLFPTSTIRVDYLHISSKFNIMLFSEIAKNDKILSQACFVFTCCTKQGCKCSYTALHQSVVTSTWAKQLPLASFEFGFSRPTKPRNDQENLCICQNLMLVEFL